MSLLDQKLEQQNTKEFRVKLLTHQKLEQENLDEVAMATEDDSERVAYLVKVVEKVETSWLFQTRAGRPCDAEIRVRTLGRACTANGQDLGAMGELPVRGSMGEIKSSVHGCVCQRRKMVHPEWNATQSEGIHVHVGSTR